MSAGTNHFAGPPNSLADGLHRGNNNFDLFRLIAALAVILGHSFSLAPAQGFYDGLSALTGQNIAAVAVKFFFFLSGLLVTDSLLARKSVPQFLIARLFRIWPGLVFVLLASVFLIGPITTNMDLSSYFSHPSTYLYIKHQVLMETWGAQLPEYKGLPGVFTENTYKNAVNASLWSLVAEVYAYLILVAVFCVGLLRKRLALLLYILVVLDSVLPSRIIFNYLPKGVEDFSYLPFCFATGAICAVYKKSITIDFRAPFGFALLFYLFHRDANSQHFFFLMFFSLVLYLATHRLVIKFLKLPIDISYGVFLWGFPIQQMLAKYFSTLNGIGHCAAAMVLACIAGVVSWYLVEQRFILAGRAISRAI